MALPVSLSRWAAFGLAASIALGGLLDSSAAAGDVTSGPRVEIALGHSWRFALQPADAGFESPSFGDSAWERVSLPHTWNAFDAQDGGAPYVRGDGWYRRKLVWSDSFVGKRVFVEFGAANRVAEAWLNGKRLGLHKGGYARFRFDITAFLERRATNILAVRVNNDVNGIAPVAGDFSAMGGIYRPVRLLVVAPVHIALQDYASAGVYLTPRLASQDAAVVAARVLVENDGRQAVAVQIRIAVRDMDGRTVARAGSVLRVPSGSRAEASTALRIPKPHLWNGLQDPYLYRTTVDLVQGGRVVDRVVQPLGLRSLAVDPETGLTLNGKPLLLHGVNRHQDFQDKGYAVTPAQHEQDFGLIREMGANSVRLAHYQHDDYVYGLCDRYGLVVWTELGFVGPPLDTDEFVENAEQQLRELIRQNYNHPSILFWGIGNETRDGAQMKADTVLKRLDAVVRKEDPTRLSTYASDHPAEDPRNRNTHVVAVNKYFGWYREGYEALGPWLDAFHANYPKVALGISEYGAGGSIYQHETHPPIRTATQARGPWHPEEWQRELHESSWLTIERRPFLWGSFIWNMFDFASDGRAEGDTAGRNDKGLVTYDRLTRKDAFYWYKAHWNPAPMVYLTSRRHDLRLEAATELRVYSNCDTVEAWLNGVSVGVRSTTNRRAVWESVALVNGPNRIYAEGKIMGKISATDSCAWTLTNGTPYRPVDPTSETTRTTIP